jgi:hypothetical protein
MPARPMHKKRHPLNEQQRRFVENYLRHGNGTKAAIQAGYSAKSAAGQATNMLCKNKMIMHLIREHQKKSEARADYNLATAMAEAREGMDIARDTENAGAYVQGAKLRSQLMGLLVEKHQVQAGFSIQISGIDDFKELKEATEIVPALTATDIMSLISEKDVTEYE